MSWKGNERPIACGRPKEWARYCGAVPSSAVPSSPVPAANDEAARLTNCCKARNFLHRHACPPGRRAGLARERQQCSDLGWAAADIEQWLPGGQTQDVLGEQGLLLRIAGRAAAGDMGRDDDIGQVP